MNGIFGCCQNKAIASSNIAWMLPFAHDGNFRTARRSFVRICHHSMMINGAARRSRSQAYVATHEGEEKFVRADVMDQICGSEFARKSTQPKKIKDIVPNHGKIRG